MQLKLRLKTLLDRKGVLQTRTTHASKISAAFVTVEEGFQQFCTDLIKLQVSKGSSCKAGLIWRSNL